MSLCIRHVQLRIVIKRPQPRHIGFEAEICTPGSFMCVWCFSCFLVLRLLIQEVFPFGLPSFEHSDKTLPVCTCHHITYVQQFPWGGLSRLVCQIPSHYYYLMKLAHLHIVWTKFVEQSTQSVAHYAMHPEAFWTKPFNSFKIVRDCLAANKLIP